MFKDNSALTFHLDQGIIENVFSFETRTRTIYFFYLNHWLGAYRTNALYSGHIFVRLMTLRMCLRELCCIFTVWI